MIGVFVRRWKLIGLVALGTVALLIFLAAIFMASGVYNVAASERHFLVTNKLLAFTLQRSIETHSMFVEVPKQNEEDLVPLGANHFSSACALCHGSPTERRNAVVLRMLPTPPPLKEAATKWTPAQLFWIVKHGLKYTGMPAWPGAQRDDEVWAVVAFLRRLPDMDRAEYRRLVRAEPRTESEERSPLVFEQKEELPHFCSRCHGTASTLPASRRVPALHGQSAGYLKRALEEYRNGTRSSGFMEPVATNLTAAQIDSLSNEYAERDPIHTAPVPKDSRSLKRGRAIAEIGIRESGIPPCLACHSGRASKQFPILRGLSADYMMGQLSLWRRGLRDETAYGAIMAVIANRLNQQQIRDVTAYLESLQNKHSADRPSAGRGGE
ncbi:c-type cytochrome [Dongia deserti]|uniref:c-type cytochrome n=1 Tax=Dongia deserti TaxID=2268030 RepID=UPI0013C4EAC6|nr:c-type cytochrome [Dongia deserti]